MVVLQLVRVLGGSDDTQVITQLLLLEVTLGQVFQLTLGEAKVLGTGYSDLGAVTGDGNIALGEVAGLSINLDALVEVLLEGGNVKNLIVNWGSTVNDELDGGLLCGLSLSLLKENEIKDITIQLESSIRHHVQHGHPTSAPSHTMATLQLLIDCRKNTMLHVSLAGQPMQLPQGIMR